MKLTNNEILLPDTLFDHPEIINGLFFNYPLASFYWDAQSDQIVLNHQLKKLLQLPHNTISRQEFQRFLAPGSKRALTNSRRFSKELIYLIPPTQFPVQQSRLPMRLRRLTDTTGKFLGINGVEFTESLFPLTRVFNIANQFQHLALKTRRREEILRNLCSLLVTEGKYCLAWIGQADFENNRVVPITWSGKGDYLENITISLDDSPTGLGPTATAIKTRRLFICRDTENDPAYRPWREEALKRGFLSTMAIPFQDEQGNILTLNLYAGEKFHFDENEVHLIEHLINDLKFALQVLHNREALHRSLRKLEKEHWKTTQFLSTSLEGFLLIDKNGRIQDVNPAYCAMSGYSRDELMGQPITILEQQKPTDELESLVNEWFQKKQGRYFTTHRTKTGEPLQLEVSFCIIESGEQSFNASFIRNITHERELIQQLEASEKQYRDLVENSPFIYGILNDDRIVYLNSTGERKFQQIFGHSIIGMNKRWLLPSDEYRRSQQRARQALSGHPVDYPVELTFQDREGKQYFFELYVISKDYSNPGNVHFILHDVTEKKKSEASLLRRDRILEAVGFAATEFLNNDFWHADIQAVLQRLGEATDADRVYIFQNHVDEAGTLRTSQIFEWVREGVTPTIDFPELQNAAYSEAGFQRWVETLETGQMIMGNVKDFPDSERELLFAHEVQSILVVPIFVDNEWWGLIGFDNCRGEFIWSSAETEALKVAANLIGASLKRQKIEEERNLLAQALKNTNDGVVITDLQQNILYANNAFWKTFGLTPSTASLPETLQLYFTNENETPSLEFIIGQTLKQGWQGEVHCQRQDGTPFTAYLSTATIKDPNENPIALIFILRDISEYKTLQSQLQQAQKMEAIGRLAGGVAHDFNNLLTIINGYTQLLLAQVPPNSSLHAELKQIYAAGERASELTNQLLAFSRKQMVHPKVYAINTLVQEMEKMIRRIIGEDIEIITHLNPNAGNIRTDRGQFQQVLLNLVVNARDAMPHGGKLLLETGQVIVDENYVTHHPGAKKGTYTYLKVRDTGTGIPKEHLSRIFEPFFTTKEQGKGTGLGLATVYGIVKQNKGFIWVESEVGQGTTFEILFPRVILPTTAESTEGPRLPVLVTQDNYTILVVEDDPGVRTLIKNILETSGYGILEAENGQQALKTLQAHAREIDLVITDIIMPEMSGHELGKQIQSTYPGIKILYMSGYSEDLTQESELQLTDSNFIQKPFTPAELLKKINRLFKQN